MPWRAHEAQPDEGWRSAVGRWVADVEGGIPIAEDVIPMSAIAYTDTEKRYDAGPVPLRIANGGRVEIPALGLGTWELKGASCREAMAAAISCGYRHFDTARAYGNEREVGRALASLERSTYWLTSKVWRDDLTPGGVRKQAEGSLKDLDVDYLDLLLVHWPNLDFPMDPMLDSMQQLVREQKVRFIGVSNFTATQWRAALSVQPGLITNQVEYHVMLGQSDNLQVAQDHDALVTAYSPLGSGEVLGNEVLNKIGERYGKSAAQVALRWLLDQSRVVAIPRSSDREHLQANIDIFDFELDDEDRRSLDELPKDQRQICPSWAPAEWRRKP